MIFSLNHLKMLLFTRKKGFLCRLPFWQRHIVLPVSQKTCHQKFVFKGSFVLKYFIELKSVNPKNSVCLSLSIYICHNFDVQIFGTSFSACFVPSFLKIHNSLNFRATTILKTVLESLFWVLSHGYGFGVDTGLKSPIYDFPYKFCSEFLTVHISLKFRATTMLKTLLESLF